jgi:hypothetical protein
MFMSHHKNLGKNHNIKITDILFENVAKFKCVGTKVTKQNCTHEESKSRLNVKNACYLATI